MWALIVIGILGAITLVFILIKVAYEAKTHDEYGREIPKKDKKKAPVKQVKKAPQPVNKNVQMVKKAPQSKNIPPKNNQVKR